MSKHLIRVAGVLALLLFATTALAQDDPYGDGVTADQPIGEVEVVSVVETEQGVSTTIQIPVSKDAFIASNTPNTNYGSASELRLGYNLNDINLGAERILLYFDLSSIPSQASIESAEFDIYQWANTPAGDSSMPFEARYLNSDWSETTVTWNAHQPEWGSVFATGTAPAELGWRRSDVTALVREWYSGSRANYGFTVIGDENPSQDRQRIYYAKEANNGLTPRLYVTYTQVVDDTPPVATVESLPEWSPANFEVKWEGYDPDNQNGTPGSGIRYYDVWYSRNGGTDWIDFRAQVTTTKTEFTGGPHLQGYDWTAGAPDNAGNAHPRGGSQARTTVDAQAPVVSVNPLPQYTHATSFTVTWGGTDSGSGIATYDVQWRTSTGPWQALVSGTTQTSFTAVGAQAGQTYLFRARGVDKVGNVGAFPDAAQAQTTIAVKPESTITRTDPLGVFQKLNGPEPGDSFDVYWKGTTASGTWITSYDVDVRKPGNSTWQAWQRNVSFESATYVLEESDPDGIYYFRVTATNNLGEREDLKESPDGSIIVDRYAPFMHPEVYMPIMMNADG